MRSLIACTAALAALALSPIATAQTAATPHELNSTEDFAYTMNSPSSCVAGPEYDSKMNKMYIATCKSADIFATAFSVGEKMDKSCSSKAEGYVCEIKPRRN